MIYVSFNMYDPCGVRYVNPQVDEIILWIYRNCENYKFIWGDGKTQIGVTLRDEDAAILRLKYDFLFMVVN